MEITWKRDLDILFGQFYVAFDILLAKLIGVNNIGKLIGVNNTGKLSFICNY